MSRINKTQFAVLGLLSRGRKSGYDLKNELPSALPYVWAESNAQIYPMLKKLEAEGAISSRVDPKSGLRQRKIYSITSLGLKQLEEYLSLPIQFSGYREELMLKLHLLDHMEPAQAHSHISGFIKHISENLDQLCTSPATSNDQDSPLIHDYARSILEAQLKWAKKAQSHIR